jgi:hypothetical protein
MCNARISLGSPQAHNGETAAALAQIEQIVVDGLKHGFFEYSIVCQIVKGGARQLVVRAGKSYQFTIRQEDIPR